MKSRESTQKNTDTGEIISVFKVSYCRFRANDAVVAKFSGHTYHENKQASPMMKWIEVEKSMNDKVNADPDEDPKGKGEPAGIEDPSGDGWGAYPLNSVFVRTEQRTVREVVNRIQNERYILDPDFQRDFVWDPNKQSKLIESCIMRIPLPVFYVAEAPDGRIIVVDGLQRLTTFVRFLNGNLKLSGLGKDNNAGSHQLQNKTFDELPLNLQERVEDTQLTMYILDAKAPERARLDIFERVNSGASLTRQQMRNALYNGPATQWLKLASEGAAFRSATASSLDSKTMRDREAINRFVAFSLLGAERYTSGDMDVFLADGLKALAQCSNEERDRLRERFDLAMNLSYKIFDRHAFRKSLINEDETADRSVINISFFEVISVVLASHESLLNELNSDALQNAIVELLYDEDFSKAITYSTNSTQAVRQRFGMFEEAMEILI